ncbi:S9 family peptidase [Bacillus sp. HMF5848]|uniref:S9 family peptidase n=1 Tax=Bacillus sp. HMF5848 TaxID=2495421 RepID=UPI000F7A896B|nr:S9 family peptidase [Bacillus sp. HMF5848]RSK29265.1 S9 family peptidase [Bacillus sp. HMF5848]
MSAEDIYSLKSVVDPQLSPDGEKIAFIQTHIDKDSDEYIKHIFMKDLINGKTKQWTFGNTSNTSPRWSPDGTKLAFLSKRTGKNQLYVFDMAGGEAEQITASINGVSQPVWSPDGNAILFAITLGEGQTLQDTESNSKKEDKRLKPMIVDRLRYKSDAVGYPEDKRQQLAIVDVHTKSIVSLTEGDFDYTPGCWSPDGKYITFTADLDEKADYRLVTDVYIMDVSTRETKKITASDGYYSGFTSTWSPDSRYIAFGGSPRTHDSATLTKLWIYNTQNDELTCMTEGLDLQITDSAIGDFHHGTINPGAIWTADSQGYYVLVSDQGNTVVYYGSVEGEFFPVIFDDSHVYGLTVDGSTHKAVVAISTPTMPGELFAIDFKTGEREQLTDVNKDFLNTVSVAEVEELRFKAHDGLDLHGWLMHPVDYNENSKYPLILEIHGGPHAMYANTYFHEFQMLAAQGYVVLYINPRGSHGYGQAFADACRGDYGGNDYKDVMSAVDYVLAEYGDIIDESRLGVTGGSYGGFMTNWIVGHTNRFKAAVTQRSISNWLSFYGVSDIGYYFTDWELKGDILDDTEKLWEHSPLKYAANVETPLLILHGERDYRCPIEQAEQLFVVLKKRNKVTRFVRFPESNHELSRSGRPQLRVERLNHIKDWFNAYL